MPLLDEETKNAIKKDFFSVLEETVTLEFHEKPGQFTEEIKALLNELKELTDKLNVEIKPADANEEGPVIIFKSPHIKGDARFYGAPTGYEFATLLEAIKMASTGKIGNPPSREFAPKINKPIKLEVFVTPTCPYCPTSAIFALIMAFLNENVHGYVYEAIEFPEKSQKYQVSGVPKTVINDGQGEFVGAYPEEVALKTLEKYL